jgi:deoxyribodipyrimidine photolyase-related protein
MSSSAILLYPHQLFEELSRFQTGFSKTPSRVYIVEDPLFFQDEQYPAHFHIQRMLLHRVSGLRFKAHLEQAGHPVVYLSFEGQEIYQTLLASLREHKITTLVLPDPCDFMLSKRLNLWADHHGISLVFKESPGFINTTESLNDFFKGRQKYAQTSFYIHQRKQLGILLDLEGKPRGGQWSFDPANRKKLPRGHHPPDILLPIDHDPTLLQEQFEVLKTQFPQAIGIAAFDATRFYYPTTHTGALQWLNTFLQERLQNFGDFEDALSQNHPHIYHSILSPLINTGLLTPQQVIEASLNYANAQEGTSQAIPINALEGFVRQIIGWREYMRAVYLREGVKIRTSNFWDHQHPMPESLYTGTTGIPPVDHSLAKLKQTAYGHHIERLMVLGNFMCLCEIHPTAVYTWFMEFFIDAYDWVMVPNVYSMSQYADGGILTTKPYISGSNYLRKMSDYPKGEWCDIWDSLYWRFIHKHRAFFEQNPRLRMITGHLDRMGTTGVNQHLECANAYLERLHA